MEATSSSPILEAISQVRKLRFRGGDSVNENGLRPYIVEHDDLARIIYFSVGIHPVCLDRGNDLEQYVINNTRQTGVRGDVPTYVIDKKLGGRSSIGNCIPVSPEADISGWKEGVDVIYNHVKQGGDRHAIMQFAMEYKNTDYNMPRFTTLYYHFVLFEKDKPVGAVMEGKVDNVMPKKE